MVSSVLSQSLSSQGGPLRRHQSADGPSLPALAPEAFPRLHQILNRNAAYMTTHFDLYHTLRLNHLTFKFSGGPGPPPWRRSCFVAFLCISMQASVGGQLQRCCQLLGRPSIRLLALPEDSRQSNLHSGWHTIRKRRDLDM